MKKILTLVFLAAAMGSYAQPKLITQAIITTKTTIVAPEEEETTAPPSSVSTDGGGGEMRIMRFLGDGETKTTTWLKGDIFKTYSETETSRTTIIRDNAKKVTITIMQMMGKTFGVSATDEDQENMRKRMDSMMQARNQNVVQAAPTASKVDIVYSEETKKIAGYNCNKAIIITTRSNGRSDSTIVWFTPELKFQGISSTGGAGGGFGGISALTQSAATNAWEQLKGFPMQYERNMPRGRKMTVVVTKIVTDKAIEDKEFEVPKDVEIKSAKDMQGGGPGMFQMRRD